MIRYIKGPITFKTPTSVILEAGGIGYQVHISLNTYAKLEKLEQVKLETYFHVKEDSQTLYGFFDGIERTIFVNLISVSGIGPNTARILLSTLTPQDVKSALINGNVALLNSVKGIGPKTANRLILELKDKMLKLPGESVENQSVTSIGFVREEAVSALITLGFNRARVEKALQVVQRNHPDAENSETLIKLALKQLS